MGLESFLKSATGGFATGMVDTGFGLVRDALGRSHANSMLKKQQEFSEKMARNKYSYEVESMLNAGLNPAMSHGTAQLATAPSTPSTPSSGQGSMKQARQLYQEEMEVLDAQKREKDAVINNENAQARKENALATLYETDAQTRNRANMADIYLKEFGADLSAEMRSVVIEKANLLAEFRNAGGVQTYIDNQTSQAGWYDADAAYRSELKSVVKFEAESHRISANASATQAQVVDFLKESQRKFNEEGAEWYRNASQKERGLAQYYAAEVALTREATRVKAVEAEAIENLGPGYQCFKIFVNDLLEAGERGVGIAATWKNAYKPATRSSVSSNKNLNTNTNNSTINSHNVNHNYSHSSKQ